MCINIATSLLFSHLFGLRDRVTNQKYYLNYMNANSNFEWTLMNIYCIVQMYIELLLVHFFFSKVKCFFVQWEKMKIWNSSKVIKAIKFNATLFSVYDSNSYTSLILHLRSEKLLRFTSFNLHKLHALELYAENIYVVGRTLEILKMPKEEPNLEVSFSRYVFA